MANRIVGNIYIIDSQTGAANSLQPNSASWLDNHLVSGFALWGADTTAAIELVFATQTDACAWKANYTQLGQNPVQSNLGEAVYFRELRCKTLVSGTGFIYFK